MVKLDGAQFNVERPLGNRERRQDAMQGELIPRRVCGSAGPSVRSGPLPKPIEQGLSVRLLPQPHQDLSLRSPLLGAVWWPTPAPPEVVVLGHQIVGPQGRQGQGQPVSIHAESDSSVWRE